MAEEKKIGAIKEELQAAEDSMLPDFIARYEKDERSGVKSLVEKAGKRIQKLEAEYARIENLKKYEKEYADEETKEKEYEMEWKEKNNKNN